MLKRVRETQRVCRKESKKISKGHPTTLCKQVLPLPTSHWGWSQGVNERDPPGKETWTKLMAESSSHLTLASSQEQATPRAFISLKAPPKTTR